MKLFIKKGDKEFSLEAADSMANGNLGELISTIHKEVFAEPAPLVLGGTKGDSETFAEHYGCLPTPPPPRDNFSIRERLPNNTVDVSMLDIKKAVVESALVRCPKCGQSHALVLKDNDKYYLMRRSYASDEFGIVIEAQPQDILSLCCMDKTPKARLEFFHKLQGLSFLDDKDFAVSNETEVFCPVCQESSSFIQWKQAWQDKRSFFEFDHICGACGGECVMDARSEKDGKNLVVCTQCGRKWLKEQV